MTPQLPPLVSVIIPVYNDSQRLKLCLEALEQQTYPKTCYEVIVVDNGSDDVETVKAIVTQFGQAIVTEEQKPGSYAARNKGISQAKGEIIAFTDADCIPATDWIEQGVKYLLQTPNCGLVAGRIELFFKQPDRLSIAELYESITAFRQDQHLAQFRYGSTANVFTFRRVLDQVGWFNDSLKSSGDLEWGQRVAASGYQQVYGADARIAHPARATTAELYKKTIRIAGGIYDGQIQKYDSFWQRNKMFVRIALSIFLYPIRFAFKVLKEPQLKTLEQKLKVAGMTFAVRYLLLFEIMRLKLGGVSRRE